MTNRACSNEYWHVRKWSRVLSYSCVGIYQEGTYFFLLKMARIFGMISMLYMNLNKQINCLLERTQEHGDDDDDHNHGTQQTVTFCPNKYSDFTTANIRRILCNVSQGKENHIHAIHQNCVFLAIRAFQKPLPVLLQL